MLHQLKELFNQLDLGCRFIMQRRWHLMLHNWLANNLLKQRRWDLLLRIKMVIWLANKPGLKVD